jgi:hypothetical protein
MASKKVTSKATTSLNDAAKATLVEKKGRVALADDTPQVAPENNDGALNSKHPELNTLPLSKAPFARAVLRTSLGRPARFYPPEADDITKDDEVLGILAKDQLKLQALRIKTERDTRN